MVVSSLAAICQDRASCEFSWQMYIPFAVFPIALCPKAVQLVIFACLLVFLMIRFGSRLFQAINFGSIEGLLLCFASIYLLSILFNSAGAESDRVVAAFNTWATWVIAIFFYAFSRQCDFDRDCVSKIALANIVLLIFLSLVHYAGIQIAFPWGDRTLSGGDWINGVRTTRLYAFFEYPTLVAAMYFIFFPLSLHAVTKWRWKLLAYCYCMLAVTPVVACSSRTGILLGVVTTLASLLFVDGASGRNKLTRGAKLFLMLLAVAFFAMSFHAEIMSAIEELLGSRQGSTDTRRLLYEYSCSRVMSTSPLLGCGIKEVVPQFGDAVPVGSHSTYIGVLYRTGFIGLIVFVAALLALVKSIALSGSENGTMGYRLLFLLVCCAFFVTEDVDGADWLLVCALTVAGFLSNRNVFAPSSAVSMLGRWRSC